MVRAASITMPSGGDRGSRAGCRRKSVMCFCSFFVFLPALLPCDVTDVTVRTIPCRYCFYSVVQKYVFRPARATRCPDKRDIWHGGADQRSAPPLPNFTFIGVEMWEYSPQNCQHFEFWP